MVAHAGETGCACGCMPPGRHMAMNALARACRRSRRSALDPARAAPALDGFEPLAGRGARARDRGRRRHRAAARRELQRQPRLDARGAASAARCSRRSGGSPCWATCWNSATRSAREHAGARRRRAATARSGVLLRPADARTVRRRCRRRQRGAHAADAAALAPLVADALRAGRRGAGEGQPRQPDEARGRGARSRLDGGRDVMLYNLARAASPDEFIALQPGPLHHLPRGRRLPDRAGRQLPAGPA